MKSMIFALATLALFSNLSLAATGFYCENDSRPVDGNYNKLVFAPTMNGTFDIYQSFAPGGMRAPGSEAPEAYENKLVGKEIKCNIDTQAVIVICDGPDFDSLFAVINHYSIPDGYRIVYSKGVEVGIFKANVDCFVTR